MGGSDGQDEAQGEAISSVQSMILDLPPSCIEFCPAHPQYFVVGTYYLERTETDGVVTEEDAEIEEQPGAQVGKPQSRNGSLLVFRLRDGEVKLLQTVSQPSAVFDLHFQPQADRGDICATVSSTGTISLFKLSPAPDTQAGTANEPIKAISVLRIPELDEDALFTYFAWHPIRPGLMAITAASGQVILVQIHDDHQGLDVIEGSVLEHSLEAWVVAFSPPPPPPPSSSSPTPDGPFTIFSGGDDSALRYTTFIPSPPAAQEGGEEEGEEDGASESRLPHPPVAMTRDHTAGVTSILPLSIPTPSGSHLVLTGSYDDTLRIFSITPPALTYGPRRARLLAEINLGGGVWRLGVVGEPQVSVSDGGGWQVTVVASCMHAGTRILNVCGRGEEDASVVVLGRFEEHNSMNYGSDWSRVESRLHASGREVVCVSTSFYDRLLCLWKFKLPDEPTS